MLIETNTHHILQKNQHNILFSKIRANRINVWWMATLNSMDDIVLTKERQEKKICLKLDLRGDSLFLLLSILSILNQRYIFGSDNLSIRQPLKM